MTDGIIQEIMTEFINAEKNIRKKGYDSVYESNEDLLQQLQKELIEKIKQEITTYGEPLSREIIYKILIGDNQE